MFTTRKYWLAAAAITTAITLSACSNAGMGDMDMGDSPASSSPEATASGFNSADVTFAQMMIPHHEQAIEMSDVILDKTGVDARVVELATQIKDAQAPEIKQLNKWLTAWDAPQDAMAGMDHSMDGMMSGDDMSALANAEGADATRLFLEQMIVHHQGAIDMAELELSEGENPDAVAMAAAIVATQSEEIAAMKAILGSL